MSKMFMVDIETTGVDPRKDEVLQIAILELTKVDGYWKPGRLYERLLGTDKTPSYKFAIEQMADLYAACNKLPKANPTEVRNEIKAFLVECGAPNMAVATGKNAAGFDLPFLFNNGYALSNYRDPITDKPVGDFHYRTYEMAGAIFFVQDFLRISGRDVLETMAIAVYTDIEVPQGRKFHDAVGDCYYQTRMLNGLIKLCEVTRREE